MAERSVVGVVTRRHLVIAASLSGVALLVTAVALAPFGRGEPRERVAAVASQTYVPWAEHLTGEEFAARMSDAAPDDLMLLRVSNPEANETVAQNGSDYLAVAAWGDVMATTIPESAGFYGASMAGGCGDTVVVAIGEDACRQGASVAGLPLIGTSIWGPVVVDPANAHLSVVHRFDNIHAGLAWVVPELHAMVVAAVDPRRYEFYVDGELTGTVEWGESMYPSPTGAWVVDGPEHNTLTDERYLIYDLGGTAVLDLTVDAPPLFVWGGSAVASVETVGGQQRAVVDDLTTGSRVFESEFADHVELPQVDNSLGAGTALIYVLTSDSEPDRVMHVDEEGKQTPLFEGDDILPVGLAGSTEHMVMTPQWSTADSWLLEVGSEAQWIGSQALVSTEFDGSRMLVVGSDGTLIAVTDGVAIPVAIPGVDTSDPGWTLWSDDGEWVWVEFREDGAVSQTSLAAINLHNGVATVPLVSTDFVDPVRLTADGTGVLLRVVQRAEPFGQAIAMAWADGGFETVVERDDIGPVTGAFFSPHQDGLLFNASVAGGVSLKDQNVMFYTFRSGAAPEVLFEGALLWGVTWDDHTPQGVGDR